MGEIRSQKVQEGAMPMMMDIVSQEDQDSLMVNLIISLSSGLKVEEYLRKLETLIHKAEIRMSIRQIKRVTGMTMDKRKRE